MPIKIPDNLPARATLEKERIRLISKTRAITQDIRPLRVLLLNLMPDKISTETQLLRALGMTPLQVDPVFIRTASYKGSNTPSAHIDAFYKTWADVKHQRFDALIVTGAPVEQMPFEDVAYWPELKEIFDWSLDNVYSSFFICWGAQAALYHFHGVNKNDVSEKHFGIYPHEIKDLYDPLVAGFDDISYIPVSRHTEIYKSDVEAHTDLKILLESDVTGVCLLSGEDSRQVYMFNHLEYDAETLKKEYMRDVGQGLSTAVPYNYFPEDNPQIMPPVTWRAHRTMLFNNWLNMIYQATPYNLDDLPPFKL
jgi:homoserine O-succinyltransferase